MLGICRFVPLYVILEYDAEQLSLGAQYVVNHGYRFGFSDTVIRLVKRLERKVQRIRRAVFSTLNTWGCSRGVCWGCFM